MAAAMISVADAQAVLAEINRTETLAPILDPTWYRAKMNNVSQHKRAVRTFVAFRHEIAAVLDEELQAKERNHR